MFMFCKVYFHVERSASQIYLHWVYILVIRSPLVLGHIRKGTLLKFHFQRAHSRQERTKRSGEKLFLFFHKSMRYFAVKETLLTIFSSSAHDRMIPFP